MKEQLHNELKDMEEMYAAKERQLTNEYTQKIKMFLEEQNQLLQTNKLSYESKLESAQRATILQFNKFEYEAHCYMIQF